MPILLKKKSKEIKSKKEELKKEREISKNYFK